MLCTVTATTPGSSCSRRSRGCRISIAFISVLHLYETFGWSRRADYINVHFAESMNEFHHLLIMEELGGNSEWIDRFLARFSAFFYYFIAVGMYMLSPRMAHYFSECVERHAYSTYDKFLKLNGAFISVLHLYETFGWWRRADYIKVHFAESMNEFHHLLIMEELGGNSVWVDGFLARFSAFFYYFMTVAMYMLSPRMAYHFSECVKRHAYSTYDKFLKLNGEELKKLPAPEAAVNYYMDEDLYLFDNLYDVFVNIRDDEAEHCKTMKACQTHGNLRSPHSVPRSIETDSECVVPEK